LSSVLNDISKSVVDVKNVDIPPAVYTGIAGGVGGGILTALYDELKKKKKKHDILRLYRSAEDIKTNEDEAIDAFLEKNSSLNSNNVVAGAAALSIPGVIISSRIKDNMMEDSLKAERKSINELRAKMDSQYRREMLDAYNLDEETLSSLVLDLRDRAGLSKESGESNIPLILGTGAVTLSSFLAAKNVAEGLNSNNEIDKKYKKKLDFIYKNKQNNATINKLPFDDEELLALELYRQEGKQKPSASLDDNEIPVDDSQVQDLLKDL